MHDTYFESKEFKEILKSYQDAQRQGESIFLDAGDMTDLAEYHHLHGQLPQAIEIIEEAINRFPGAVYPLAFRARIALLKEKDMEKALEYAKLIEDQSDPEYIFLQAEMMLTKGQVQEANRYLHQEKEPLDEEELADFVLDTATLFADYEQMELAEEWLQLSSETDHADYKELQGRIAISKGNYEESQHIFNQLLDEDPYAGPYWNHLAHSQLMQDKVSDSITSSEFSIAINPNDEEAILNKANALYSLGNYEKALEYFQRFSQLCPQEETGEMYQGITLLHMNQLDEAVRHLRIAKDIIGEQPQNQQQTHNLYEIYRQMAFTLSRLGRLEKAMDYVDRAEELNIAPPSDLDVIRGHLMLENGQVNQAYQYYGQAVEESLSGNETILNIAVSVFDCGYQQMAYQMFQSLLDNCPDSWIQGHAYMALCCKELGKREEYLFHLAKAIEKNPAEARTVLADLFPAGTAVEDYPRLAAEDVAP